MMQAAHPRDVFVGPFLVRLLPAGRLVAVQSAARRVVPQMPNGLGAGFAVVDQTPFDDEAVFLEVGDFRRGERRARREASRVLEQGRLAGHDVCGGRLTS